MYEAEGNDPQTYLLLYRHAQLVLNHLAKHPDKTLPENKKGLQAASKAVNGDLAKLEVIAPRIRKRHAEYLERKRAQQEALKKLEGRGDHVDALPRELDALSLDQRRKRRSYERPTLDGGQNTLLAAKLAQKEVRRRDIARRSVRQASLSEEQEQERRVAGVWGDWEKEYRRASGEQDDDLSSQLQEVARMQHQNGHKPPNFSVSCAFTL